MASIPGGRLTVNPFHLDDAGGAMYRLGGDVQQAMDELTNGMDSHLDALYVEPAVAHAAAVAIMNVVDFLSHLDTALVEFGDRLHEASNAYQESDSSNQRVFGPGEGTQYS